MSDEAAFLSAILANPDDDAPRLIYADWLEERGDLAADAKAAFLRDTTAALTAQGRRAKAITKRLHQAADALPDEWLAVVSRLVLEKCSAEFEFVCPKRWEKLTATDDVKVRHCEQCQQSVHYCTSIPEARGHAMRGECVAVQLGLPRRPHDLEYAHVTMGVMMFEPEERA
jgi:uncharacterized protein (TIGR02996 family)